VAAHVVDTGKQPPADWVWNCSVATDLSVKRVPAVSVCARYERIVTRVDLGQIPLGLGQASGGHGPAFSYLGASRRAVSLQGSMVPLVW